MKRNVRAIAAGILVLLMASFLSLGIWQLQRLEWKLTLIKNIEAQQSADYRPAPSPQNWDTLTPYQKISVSGKWIENKDTLVLAVTKLGRGYWIMTPLETDQGFTILINRGFVPDKATAASVQAALSKKQVTIKGLLRESESSHAFLQDNDPAAERWYGRHIEGITAARGLHNVAPYFMDAEANSAEKYPVGGLTVLQFRNNHLMYAVTWFGLMGLSLIGLFILIRNKSDVSH